MELSTHLTFSGQCEAAFRFYEKVLGAKNVFFMTWRESPMASQAPAEWGGKVLHATLAIGDVRFSGADMPLTPNSTPQGFTLTLNTRDPQEAERLYTALAENGSATMPLAETFWAYRFGILTDQFGIPWMINCEKPM